MTFIKKFYEADAKMKIGGDIDFNEVMQNVIDNSEKSDTTEDDPEGDDPEKKTAEPEVKKKDDTTGKKEEVSDKKDDKTEKTDTTVKADEIAKPEATTAKPEAKPTDWKSEVRKQKKEDVLKELGYDEHVIKMLNYRETNHDLTPFLKATTANWDKVSDLDLVTEELRQEHSYLSDEDFNEVADDLLDRKYNLSSTDDREKKLAGILLKSEAAKIRAKRKEEDKNFLDTVAKPEAKAEQSRAEYEAAIQQQKDAFANAVAELPEAKKLLSEKQIVTGSGFKYKVDSDAVLKIAKDPQSFFALFDKDGKTDWDGLFATISYALDRKNYDKLLTDHGKTLGGKEADDELDNAGEQEKKNNPGKKETLGSAFAKRGVEFTLE